MRLHTPTLWLGRLALSAGVQGRGWNGQNPTWLGFAYGSWLPNIRVKRTPGCIPGVFAYWLCFHAVADLWPVGQGQPGVRVT